MDPHLESLKSYIWQQLQSGQTPDEIAGQLKSANWPDETVHQAFAAIQTETVPSAYASASPGAAQTTQTAHPQANGKKRGRLRTGWQLFKQSMAVLNGNRYLLRYLIMTGIWAFGITAAFMAIYIFFDHALYQQDYNGTLTPLGYAFAFFDYVLVYFFINIYAAGLTANVFDIFEGNRKSYQDYMHAAWSKFIPILVYSVIEAIVGMILRYVVERIKGVGWILAWILGTLWSLGTLFVIPIIVADEKPSGVRSIKQSMSFFKQTWGENVAAKVSVNGPLFLLNLVLIAALMVSLFAIAFNGGGLVLVWVAFWTYFVITLILAVIGSFANSLINIALFYYATYHRVPPAFNEELLNQVFIKRSGGFFRRGPKEQPVA